MISGPHFKGATAIAAALTFSAVTFQLGRYFYGLSPVATSIAVGGFVGQTLFAAFKAGALAGPLNAALDCFFGPTNQFVGLQASRYWAESGER